MTFTNNINKVLQTINIKPGENVFIWWSCGQPYSFHSPHHEIFSWSHGEMTFTNNINKVLQTINIKPGEKVLISWSRGQPYSFHSPHHEIYSWSHGQPYSFHPPHHEIFSLPLWIILTKLFRLSTCNKKKIWWSHVFLFSQWDHEMSHSLLVNLSVFTHLTMRFSHGLIVKWPLWII